MFETEGGLEQQAAGAGGVKLLVAAFKCMDSLMHDTYIYIKSSLGVE